MEARANKGKNYYLTGLRSVEVPAADGVLVKLEQKPLGDITKKDVEYVVKVWRERKKARGGVKHGDVAIRKLLQTLRHLFNWAIKEGYVDRTPFRREGVAVIPVKASTGRNRRLRDGEEEVLLAAADPYTKDLMMAALETGCRGGELRSLQWSEVQPKYFVILAAKAKDRQDRMIPISPTLQKILDRRRKGPDGNDLSATSYVFGNEVGEQMKKEFVGALWRETCKAANVEDLHFHDLRREFGSQLLEAGAPIHAVRDALGHSSVKMTDHYLATNSLEGAYKRLAQHRARKRIKLVAKR